MESSSVAVAPLAPPSSTLLFDLARANRVQELAQALAAGCPVDAKNADDQTALHVAATYGAVEAMRELLEQGADIKAVDRHGNTAVMYAVANNQAAAVAALIAKEGVVQPIIGADRSLVTIAILAGASEVLDVLFAHGADPLQSVGIGNALHWAASAGKPSCLSAVLRQPSVGKEIDSPAVSGMTALQLAAQGGYDESVALLLYAGADPNARDKYGNSALMLAARARALSVVKLLIAVGVRLDLVSLQLQSALHLAVLSDSPEIVRVLLDAGAMKDQQDAMGDTPIHYASKNGSLDCVRILKLHGADTTIRNKGFKLARDVAKTPEIKAAFD